MFFSKKMTLRAASLEKLPCHMDFSHISLIALLQFYLISHPKLHSFLGIFKMGEERAILRSQIWRIKRGLINGSSF